MMIRITAPHFCAGVLVGVRAAPIVGYMRTWLVSDILQHCMFRGWVTEIMLPSDLA